MAANTTIYQSQATVESSVQSTEWTDLYNTSENLQYLAVSYNNSNIVVGATNSPILFFIDSKGHFTQDNYLVDQKVNSISRIAMNDSGSYFCVATSNGAFQNSGEMWNNISSDSFDSTGVSGDGRYVLFAANSGKYVLFSSNYGETFQKILESSNAVNYYDIAISFDGKYQILPQESGFVSVSYDYGKNIYQYQWQFRPLCVAVSSDGKYLTLSDEGHIYVTQLNDQGFYDIPVKVKDISNFRIQKLTMDQSGQKQVASGDGGYYTSVDYGRTWTLSEDSQFANVVINRSGLNLTGVNTSIYSKNFPTNTMLITDVVPSMVIETIDQNSIQTFEVGDVVININSVQTPQELFDVLDSHENNVQLFKFENCENVTQYFEIRTM